MSGLFNDECPECGTSISKFKTWCEKCFEVKKNIWSAEIEDFNERHGK